MRRSVRILLALTFLSTMFAPSPASAVFTCGDQFGTSVRDEAHAITTDGASIWVAGNTYASMSGQPYKAQSDMFVRKYDGTCSVAWTREFGTKLADYTYAIDSDPSGNVYVAGTTAGKIKGGGTFHGGNDALVRAYDPNGALLWQTEFGTASFDDANGLVVAGSKVFVGGDAGASLGGQPYMGGADAFVRALKRSNGKTIWTREFGTKKTDFVQDVAFYGGTVFAGGLTSGVFKNQSKIGDQDMFLRSYSASGTTGFTKQFGTTKADSYGGLDADASGEVIAGTTEGEFPTFTNTGSVQDGFVLALDTNGNSDWVEQFGTSTQDLVKAGIIVGSTVYFAGDTFGNLAGANLGGSDAFVGSIDRTNGSGLSFVQYATSGSDAGNAITGTGIVWIAGETDGSLAGPNLGYQDAWFDPCCA